MFHVKHNNFILAYIHLLKNNECHYDLSKTRVMSPLFFDFYILVICSGTHL